MSWLIEDTRRLVEHLRNKADVYGPVGGDRITFEKLPEGRDVNLSRVTDVSARHMLQPMTHYYLRFKDRPGADVTFDDYADGPRIVIGLRPCDLAGLQPHDKVFAESSSYRRLRDMTTIVGYLCQRMERTCFCDSMGGDPHSREGMDLVLYPGPAGAYVLEAETDRGRQLMEGAPFETLAEPPAPPLEKSDHQTLDTEGLEEALASIQESPFWDEIGFACVNCRVCTYVCPTCHCFTVTDEVFRTDAARAVVWDSCQNKLFTKEASGHNPRASKSARVRQRILHKFSHHPKVHGDLMCSGCGRCIIGCPTGRNIVEELTLAKEASSQ